jgi:hypothetical protein
MNGSGVLARRMFAGAALVAGGLASLSGSAQGQRFAVGGGQVAFYNLAGEVSVAAGGGTEVVVEVTRAGDDAGDLRVERFTSDGWNGVRVVYPDRRIVYPRQGRMSSSTVSVRPDGRLGGGGGSHSVTIAGWGWGTHAWADARLLVPAGRSVTIHQAVGRVTVANVNGQLSVRTAAAGVSTRDTRGDLSVDVGSGGVEVDGAEGSVRLDAGSGGVHVSRVRGTRLNVDTGSGGVTGGDVQVGSLKVDVGSGGVDLAQVSADSAYVDAGSGSVRLGLRSGARWVRLESGSGGVHLRVPPAFGAEVSIETGSGGIDVDFPVEMRRSSRSHLEGRIGDGRGTLRIETGSGGVHIERS